MSLNVIPLSSQKVIPPVFDYKQNKIVEMVDGGENILFQPFSAASTTSNSISVKCDPPSKYTVVDPFVMQYAEVFFTLTATNNDTVPRRIFEEFGKSGQETAPRSYPLTRCTQNVEMVINSSSFSTTPYDYLDGVQRYGYLDQEQENEMSLTPTMLDNSYDYALSYNAPQRDPLNGDYYQSGKLSSRGSYCDFTLVPNPSAPFAINPVIAPGDTGTATCKLVIQERLMLSPFYYQRVGFVQVSTMQYILTLGDLSRMLCRRATKTPLGNGVPLNISNIASNISVFNLYCKFYTPKLLDSIPANSVYDYLDVQNLGGNSSQTVLAAGAKDTAIMNATNLNAIPSRIYVWVAENRAEQSFANGGLSKPDVANAFINKISVQWQGIAGNLSSASSRQLYDMSCKNGLQMTWNEYSKLGGSFMCIDVPRDLGLKSNQNTGLLSAPQLGMTVEYTNISNRSIKFTLYVKVIYDGVMTNIGGAISKQVGIFSQTDSIKSFNETPIVEQPKENITQMGGIIGGYRGGFNPLMLASIIKNVVKGVSGVADFVNPIAKKGVELAESIGLGGIEEEEELREALNRKYLGSRIGGKMIKGKGGKFISRNELY